MNKTKEALENMGCKILNNSRTELYLSMHFMGGALSTLDYVMDLSTASVGTDAAYIRFNPNFLRELFIEHPRRLNRTYIHMLMHCLFLHMYSHKDKKDKDLWDLSCDIAVEAVIDSMECDAISDVVTDKRNAIYEKLRENVGVLTAEKLYRFFYTGKRDYVYEAMLEREFWLDDHSFWLRLDDEGKNNNDRIPPNEIPPEGAPASKDDKDKEPSGIEKDKILPRGGSKEEDWKKNAKRLRSELSLFGNKASAETGSLERLLSFELKDRTDYTEFLKRFRVLREEASIDMDSFDYGFYCYGMELYGNMPLIEENEYREANRIEELVIAVDTSASCQDTLVQKFLNETAQILFTHDTFFKKVNIHIVECDDQIQKDILIKSPDDMKKYAAGFSLKGGFGTDFRPVFSYVEELRKKGALKHLKGLMYFTDGFGTYPKHPTDYDTAFVFRKDEEMNDKEVPSWAMKLYI